MIRTLSVAVLTLALFTACGKDESSSSSSGGGSGTGQTAPPASKYGTPESTAAAFIAAATSGDWLAAGECCSKTAAGIDEIRDQKLTEHEREGIKGALTGVKAEAATKSADGKTAEVKFKMMKDGKERQGVMKMEMEGSDWKLTDIK